VDTIFACLFIGVLIPSVLAVFGTFSRMRQFGAIDNKDPRGQSAKLEGVGARAVAAQQNAWEALAVFIAGVVAFSVQGGDPEAASTWALVWVVARIGHALCYLANLDVLRSLIYFVGLVAALALFFV
jgi:uncharacterized MAPEG superfamily protein